MAEVTKYKAEKLVKKEVDVYQLELSREEFVTLRTYLGDSTLDQTLQVDNLDASDDKRLDEIYSALLYV